MTRITHWLSMTHWKRERRIRIALKSLTRQRVVMILQPGNVMVIEQAPRDTPETHEAIETCRLRGWAEPVWDAMRQGNLTAEGKLPEGELYNKVAPVFRPTEAGWHVIRRTNFWIVLTCAVAFLTLVATLLCLRIMSSG